MAEAAAAGAIVTLGRALVDLGGFAIGKYKLLKGTIDDIKWIRRELQWMQAFLKENDLSSFESDEVLKSLVVDLRNAAYEAEDIAEEITFRPERPSSLRYVFNPLHMKWLHDVGKNIRKLRSSIEDINRRRGTYVVQNINVNNVVDVERRHVVEHYRSLAVDRSANEVIGLENDTRTIKDLLLGNETPGRLVITIVGMGGLGKTTLARKVFNEMGDDSFPVRIWLTISQKCMSRADAAKELLIELARQISPSFDPQSQMNREELSKYVKARLEGRRYLIVMDDVWEENVWELMMVHFPDDSNRSRVIITTRNENVACSLIVHRLTGLNERHSWELFTRAASVSEEEINSPCNRDLKELALKLVKKCGGSPLALTVLGGLVARKEMTFPSWQKIASSWREKDGMDVLKLSYEDLPYHLKCCFLYFSAFPEDYEIEIERLVNLWIAEGFISRAEENNRTRMEDVGREFLDEMNERCLIQIVEHTDRYYDYSFFTYNTKFFCKVHDLLHDLSIREAKKRNFMIIEKSPTHNELTRRCAFSGEAIDEMTLLNQSLRALLAFNTQYDSVDLKGFKHLRVLELERTFMKSLPDNIGHLMHLRYLSVRNSPCGKVSKSICRLSNIQTLDLRRTSVTSLPSGIWKIKALRHVYCDCEPNISETIIPVDIQTLEGVRSGPWIGTSLEKLTNLRSICMECRTVYRGRLKFPSHLVRLNLHYLVINLDIWTQLQGLQSLKILKLHGCSLMEHDMVCYTGGFPQLEVLEIGIKISGSWTIEDGSMTKLTSLSIKSYGTLEMLPEGLQHLTSIQTLHLSDRDSRILERIQNETREDWYKICNIPNLKIEESSFGWIESRFLICQSSG